MHKWCWTLLRCALRLRIWCSLVSASISATSGQKRGNWTEPRVAGCCAKNSPFPTSMRSSYKSGSILPAISKEPMGPIKDPRDAWCTFDDGRGGLNVTYKACSSASGHSTSKCSVFSGTSSRHLPIHVVFGAVNANSSPLGKKPRRPAWMQIHGGEFRIDSS